MITRYSHSFFFLYTDHLKETIQHTTSHQSIKSLQFSSVTSTTNDDEIVPSTPYTMTDSHNIESTFINSESPDIISSITTTTIYPNIGSSKYNRDPPYITSSNIDIISSTKSYVDHPGLTTVDSYVSLDVVSQYQSRTPKYIIFLATIPTRLLFIGITMTLVKVIIKRQRLRRGAALRRTSRRPIVRDLGSLQMTCVVNESNVEGIEMQER